MVQAIEIFLHGKGKPQVISANDADTLYVVLAAADALPAVGEFVFVGEAFDEHGRGDAEDTQHPVDLGCSLIDLGLGRHGHVHTRAVHRVDVEVRFNGQEVKHWFSPAATVERATNWAKRRLGLDPKASADLVLILEPTKTQPRPDQHLGELLERGHHSLKFDLIREMTPQG